MAAYGDTCPLSCITVVYSNRAGSHNCNATFIKPGQRTLHACVARLWLCYPA
jgi:hypothetical protein